MKSLSTRGDGLMKRLLLPLALLALAGGLRAQTPEEYHRRADRGLQAFLLRFWAQGLGYLRHSYPAGQEPTGYWTFAQGFDALLDGVERTGGRRYAGLVETFYRAQDQRGWIAGFYDDESWMTLALIRAYDLTGDGKYLTRARSLYSDIEGGWDTTCCGAAPGGIWWDKAHSQKATASNAGPVIAGARLSRRLQDPAYLAFARKVYAYWFQNMVDSRTFEVIDHLLPDGSKVRWGFTYNAGLMLGAATELHLATGESRYLDDANHIAGFMIQNQVAVSQYGKVLTDGSNQSCAGDCQAFKGPAYRYLTNLYQVTKRKEQYDVLKGSADAIWNLARTPSDDLFSVSWTGPPMSSYSEPQVSAAVMALNLFAASAGPAPESPIEGRYEAEEAAIWGVGLEAQYAGYSGWGYLAGWKANGQRVDFKVDLSGSNRYEIAFRYAAGAGTASRVLALDGATLQANLVFPGTGAWTSYGTVSLRPALASGRRTISLFYDSAKGSQNFLNLDHLQVTPLPPAFKRGDATADGSQDLSDAIRTLGFLFLGDPTVLACQKAADSNDDGELNITDPVHFMEVLFLGRAAPEGFFDCGPDPTPDGLSCDSHALCP